MSKLAVRVAVLTGLVVLLFGGLWLWWNDANSPVSSAVLFKTFVITKDENIRSVATRLKNDGFIKDQIGFFLKVRITGFDKKIQAGNFRLSPSMNVSEIIEELTHGKVDVRVTTLEGWRMEEVASKFAQELSIPESEILKIAKEGYMFPDTYLVPQEATATAIMAMLSENFDKRVTPEIRASIESRGLNFKEGIILASLVEREGKTDTDRPVIAGILLNRLKEKWPLQVDATLQYALGYQPQERSWWKKTLYNEDKEVDSPYNTYKHTGLPPGPICNPGLSAIKAVANPTQSEYFYYLHDKEGSVHYAKTLAEHEANVEKFLR